MSDRVAKLDPDSDGTARRSMNHYQAAWMDHWKNASHKLSAEVHSHLWNSSGPKKEDRADSKKYPLLYENEMTTNISNYSEARTDDTLKKNLRTFSKLGKEILDEQPLPLFTNRGNDMSWKNNAGTSSDAEAVKYQIDLNDDHSSLALGRSELAYPEGISRIPQQPVKPLEFLERIIDVGSCSKIVPYVVHNGLAPTQSFVYQHENIDQPSNDSLNKQSRKVENHSSTRLLPSFGGPKANESGKGYDEHFLLPRIPRSAHDVKTMKICTTSDSLEGLTRGHPKISQTTHQFFITNKTGVSDDARVSPRLKENMFNEFLSLSPWFSFHGQKGVKLQPLESSTDSERKENVEGIRTSTVCLKNESSMETDAMELDVIQKSLLSSVALCPTDQNIKGVHKSSSSEIENATGEAGYKMNNTELPDMNEELPTLPVAANSTEDGGASTSRTQSLDAEHLFRNAEKPSNSNTSSACPDGPVGTDPSSRWVKRLKLNTSDPFAFGTKSSKLGEVSSRVKINTTSKTSSEPTLDQTPMLLKNGDSTSSGSVRKSREKSRSRVWIHRWCRHRAAPRKRKPAATVICEPQSLKATSDELQEKHFPSTAAMALMGKAMNGFHPCEFRRSGSLIVWNT